MGVWVVPVSDSTSRSQASHHDASKTHCAQDRTDSHSSLRPVHSPSYSAIAAESATPVTPDRHKACRLDYWCWFGFAKTYQPPRFG